MSTTISLADLDARGVALQPHEAVAVAQALIHATPDASAHAPFGPPTADTVFIDGQGHVQCSGCATTPAVFEIGILLQSVLRAGTPNLPGGLRYGIARSLLEVEAPPFDSLADFSRTLARFERGDRAQVIAELWMRGVAAGRVLAHAGARDDRRRTMPPPDELRRQLRDADRRLYEQRQVAFSGPPARKWTRRAPVAACVAAGLSLIAAGELMHVNRQQSHAPAAAPARRVPATAPSVAPAAAPAVAASASSTEVARADSEDHIRSGRVAPTPAPQATASKPSRQLAAPAERPRQLATRQDASPLVAPTDRPAAPAAGASLVHALGSRDNPVFSPAFASNGTPIFFHSGSNGDQHSALLAAGDDLRVMTIVDDGARNYHVQPSPDGSSIAFDSDRDGERGVYLAHRDGSNVRRVSGPGYAAVPTWSPDGRQLAFVRAEPSNARVWNLWLMTLATGETRRLTSFRYGQTWNASWFPDGGHVAYAHEDRLIVEDLAAGRSRVFTSPMPRHLVRTPAVSPDGSKIVFQVYRHGVWLLDLHDGSTRCILQDPTAEEFAWAPDGRRIAFHSRRDGQWGIWTMSPL